MTAEEAYDDCIKAAREAAKRQRAKVEPDEITSVLFSTAAATTLESFADMLTKMKEIRCQK